MPLVFHKSYNITTSHNKSTTNRKSRVWSLQGAGCLFFFVCPDELKLSRHRIPIMASSDNYSTSRFFGHP